MILTCASLGVATLALVACATPESRPRDSLAAQSSALLTVDPAGIGRARTGVTLSQLSTVLGEELRVTDGEICSYVRPKSLPLGVSLMVESDTVVRVEVDSTGVKTSAGVQVGDSEPRVLEAYKGLVQMQPHKYTGPEGHYLVVTPPGDSVHRIIFETDGKVVLSFRAGRRPAVEYVEGCL